MHFTYRKPQGDLQQGDLLNITDEIRGVLSKYYSYYANHPDYSYFMVLTQSCDLDRYGGKPCKARYITIAAVRPIGTVFSRELEKHQRSSLEKNGNLCSSEKQHWIRDFIIRLLNNNIPEYFYLAEDSDFGLDQANVAFLKLAVPIKVKHYKICLNARFVQLDDIFQAKLGWLIGNLYSRVGTPDWVPQQTTEEEFDSIVEETLNNICLWIDDPILEHLKKELKARRKIKGKQYCIPQAGIVELIDKYANEQEAQTEKNIDLILQHIKKTLPRLTFDDIGKLKRQLMYNEEVRHFLE